MDVKQSFFTLKGAWRILVRLLHYKSLIHFQQNTSTHWKKKLKIWNETVTLFSLPVIS